MRLFFAFGEEKSSYFGICLTPSLPNGGMRTTPKKKPDASTKTAEKGEKSRRTYPTLLTIPFIPIIILEYEEKFSQIPRKTGTFGEIFRLRT